MRGYTSADMTSMNPLTSIGNSDFSSCHSVSRFWQGQIADMLQLNSLILHKKIPSSIDSESDV